MNNFIFAAPVNGAELLSICFTGILYLLGMVQDMKAVAGQNAEFKRRDVAGCFSRTDQEVLHVWKSSPQAKVRRVVFSGRGISDCAE